jgi:hypothetical protein
MAPPVVHPASTTAYRRSARKLRARFSRHPALLQRALSDLARHHDRNTSRHQPTPRCLVPATRSLHGLSPDPITAAIERAFADHVTAHLNGPVLHYSNRLSLLKAAERLRINRFRANLIIALVQHESARESISHSPPSNAIALVPRPRWTIIPTLAMVLFSELAMIVGAIWALHVF